MKALVLGGNGFIGSHVVDRLLADGHRVRVFDRQPEKYRQQLMNVEYMLASFDDIPSLAEAMEGIDIVYHLLSTTVPSTSNRDPVYDIESNLVGTVRLLNLMRDSSVKRIVYLSSGGTVYGAPEVSPIPETHPLKPICSYGVVKVAIENYLRMYQSLHGIDSVIIRASNPYGERQGHTGVQGVIGTFMWKVLTGQEIEIWGDGSVVRDFIYVGDLADITVCAGTSSRRGIFNIGSGEGVSISGVLESIKMVSGRSPVMTFLPGRSYDVPSVVLDISKACSEFGWKPETDLKMGLTRTWNWLKRQSG